MEEREIILGYRPQSVFVFGGMFLGTSSSGSNYYHQKYYKLLLDDDIHINETGFIATGRSSTGKSYTDLNGNNIRYFAFIFQYSF